MLILNLCDSTAIVKIMTIVNFVIKLIRIFVPIILIIMCMLDLVKAVFNGELSKQLKLIVLRLITAVLVFLIPIIVNLIIGVVDPKNEYGRCLKMDTDLIIHINDTESR